MDVDRAFAVRSVAFSPDGAYVLSGHPADGEAKLWDAAGGRHVRTFHHGVPGPQSQHRLRSLAVAFSADGARVLTGGPGDHVAKLWDTATGRVLQSFGGLHGDLIALGLSPDGSRVLVARKGGASQGTPKNELELWDVATGKLIRSQRSDRCCIDSVAFAPDGTPLLSWPGAGRVQSWDVATGRLLPKLTGLPANAVVLAVSRDGTRAFLSSSGPESTYVIWDVTKGQAIQRLTLPHASPINSVAVSLDGKRILSGSTIWNTALTEIMQWDAATGKLLSRRLLEAKDDRSNGAISRDGVGLLLLSFSSRSMSTRFWDSETAVHIGDLKTESTRRLALSKNLAHLLYAADKTIERRDLATERTILKLEGHAAQVLALAFSSEDAHIVSGDMEGTIKVWDAATGRLVRTMTAPEGGWLTKALGRKESLPPVDAVAFSPDAAHVLSCHLSRSGDERFKVWDVASGRLVRSFGSKGPRVGGLSTCSISFSPDGARVVSVDDKINAPGNLTMWDFATGQVVHGASLVAPSVAPTAFTHDSRLLLSVGPDHTIRIQDARTGEPVATLLAALNRTADEWLIVTPDGFFDTSTPATARALLSIVHGLKASAIDDAIYQVLHRPDLVRAKLAGDPDGKVQAAAAELEAKLGLH
jgi:WD40 repeat protein